MTVQVISADISFKAIYTVFLTLGSLFGGACGSYIVAAGGIPWVHWVNVILSAVTFVLCLVFQAETLYDRPQTTVQLSNDQKKSNVETKESVIVADSAVPSSSYPPYTYMRALKLVTYRPGIVQKFIAPYKTMRLPGVWLVSLWYAGLVGLIVTLSTIGTQLVAVPPYLWGKNVGLINIGGLIGAFVGCVRIPMIHSFELTKLTRHSRSTHTCPPIGQPSVSRRKTATASRSPNHVSSLRFPRSSLLRLAPSSSASWRRTLRLKAGWACSSGLPWWLLGLCKHRLLASTTSSSRMAASLGTASWQLRVSGLLSRLRGRSLWELGCTMLERRNHLASLVC
jgi:hypothetical protein